MAVAPERRLHHILQQLRPCRAAGSAPGLLSQSPADVDIVDVSGWVDQEASGEAADDDSRALAVTSMSRSLHRSGLCLVVGHGVSAALQERVYAAALHFFHQPRDVKERFASRQKGTPGWMAAGQQRLGQTLSRKTLPADMNEFLIFSTAFEGHPDARGLGDSVAVVPTVPADLPALFDEYTAAMKQLNLALMRLTATALGESEQFFEPFFEPGQYTLQMRYYEATPPGFAPAPGQMRIGAHADSNGFTIVRLDGKPGLQVRLQDNDSAERRWVDVNVSGSGTAITECLVVNTGRMVERWTGGYFKAAVHRVLASPPDNDYGCVWI